MDHRQANQRIADLEAELKRVYSEKAHSHSTSDKVQYEQLGNQIETKITLEKQNKTLDELVTCVVKGNGKPSLLIRMDRIEQSEKKRTWFWRAIITGLVGLIGLAIIQAMVHAGLR